MRFQRRVLTNAASSTPPTGPIVVFVTRGYSWSNFHSKIPFGQFKVSLHSRRCTTSV